MSKHTKSRETLLDMEGENLENVALSEFDKAVSEKYGVVCGIDEAGRGPIAGPVFAAAVVLDPGNPIKGLNDSKKLTPKKRKELHDKITEKALAFSVRSVSSDDIDKTDILSADLLAMKTAFEDVLAQLEKKRGKKFDGIALVDGDVLPDFSEGTTAKNVIGGDAKSEAIAAASILAKVERDEEMCAYAEKYPGYGFEKHKGYGTKAHYEAIDRLGVCAIHRKSFLKKYFDKRKNG